MTAILHAYGDRRDDYYAAIWAAASSNAWFRDEELQAWVVVGFPECKTALAMSELSKSARLQLPTTGVPDYLIPTVQEAHEFLSRQMIFEDSTGQAPRSYWKNALRSDHVDLQKIAAETLYPAAEEDRLDIYSGMLVPFVSKVVSYRLGIAESDRAGLFHFVQRYVRFFDAKGLTASDVFAAARSSLVLRDYAEGQYDQLVSVNGGHTFACDKWLSDFVLVLMAGHESAAFLVATALICGCRSDSWDVFTANVAENPERIISEALRIDSPVQLIGRSALIDCHIGDLRVRAGDRVFLHIGAAARDARVFDQPEQFDPARERRTSLAFGSGPFACIGASLATRESIVALKAVAGWIKNFQIETDFIVHDNGLSGRGYRAIPIARRHS